uniref:1-alkyl-2-acetylglycerophosphocholine esterase n=1 Tax=Steinernema glaseri TaxID=37863 RepID=A0A1I7YMU2_9BILA
MPINTDRYLGTFLDIVLGGHGDKDGYADHYGSIPWHLSRRRPRRPWGQGERISNGGSWLMASPTSRDATSNGRPTRSYVFISGHRGLNASMGGLHSYFMETQWTGSQCEK